MTGVGGAELFGRLSGLLAQLTVGGVVDDVPGLLAQSPEAASLAGSFLNRLQNPAIDRRGVRYSVICSEFEPTALVPNLKALAKAAAEARLDAGLDALFASANDLVVNTAHAWGIGCSKEALTTVPALLDGRVLLFAPPGTLWAPAGLTPQHALGIHHCNLFSQPLVHTAIKGWLNQG